MLAPPHIAVLPSCFIEVREEYLFVGEVQHKVGKVCTDVRVILCKSVAVAKPYIGKADICGRQIRQTVRRIVACIDGENEGWGVVGGDVIAELVQSIACTGTIVLALKRQNMKRSCGDRCSGICRDDVFLADAAAACGVKQKMRDDPADIGFGELFYCCRLEMVVVPVADDDQRQVAEQVCKSVRGFAQVIRIAERDVHAPAEAVGAEQVRRGQQRRKRIDVH